MRAVLAASLVFLLTPALSPAESLGAAAERNRARRSAPAASPSYGDSDLLTRHADAPASTSDRQEAEAGPGGAHLAPPTQAAYPGTHSPAPSDTALAEGYWRSRAQAQLHEIEEQESLLKALEQGRTPPLETITLSCGKRVPPGRRVVTLQARIERARTELIQARQAWAALEEEARVQRVPPGWLR